jgi:hypothetical protein
MYKLGQTVCCLTSVAVELQAMTFYCAVWGLSWLLCWRFESPSAALTSASCTRDCVVPRVPRGVARAPDSVHYMPGVLAPLTGSHALPSQYPDHRTPCHSLIRNWHLIKSLYKNEYIFIRKYNSSKTEVKLMSLTISLFSSSKFQRK